MNGTVIALICAAIVIIVAAAVACAYMIKIAILREKVVNGDENLGAGGEYDAAMRAGRKWYASQKHEDVEITSRDGLKLRGELLKNGDNKQLIILMHGFHGGGLKDFAAQLKMYYDMGFAILMPSQRAHGKSKGKYICYGIKERYDCLDWALLMEQMFRPNCMYLAGVSMGAATVMYASALKMPACVHGIIADCGFTSPRDEFKYVATRGRRSPLVRPLLGLMRLAVLVTARFDIDKSTTDALRRAGVPALFIHGEADDFVPMSMTLENYAACVTQKRLEIFPNAKHAVSMMEDTARARNILAEFFAQTGSAAKTAKRSA